VSGRVASPLLKRSEEAGVKELLTHYTSDNSCIDVLRQRQLLGTPWISNTVTGKRQVVDGERQAATIRGGREYRGAVSNPAEKDGKIHVGR
jgi:hypothetical protein